MFETFNIFIIFALSSNAQTQCCAFKKKCWNSRFIFEPHAEARSQRDAVTSETCPLRSTKVLGIPFCWRSRHRKQINQTGKRKPPIDYLSCSFQGRISHSYQGVFYHLRHKIRCRVEAVSYEKLISLIYLWPHIWPSRVSVLKCYAALNPTASIIFRRFSNRGEVKNAVLWSFSFHWHSRSDSAVLSPNQIL